MLHFRAITELLLRGRGIQDPRIDSKHAYIMRCGMWVRTEEGQAPEALGVRLERHAGALRCGAGGGRMNSVALLLVIGVGGLGVLASYIVSWRALLPENRPALLGEVGVCLASLQVLSPVLAMVAFAYTAVFFQTPALFVPSEATILGIAWGSGGEPLLCMLYAALLTFSAFWCGPLHFLGPTLCTDRAARGTQAPADGASPAVKREHGTGRSGPLWRRRGGWRSRSRGVRAS